MRNKILSVNVAAMKFCPSKKQLKVFNIIINNIKSKTVFHQFFFSFKEKLNILKKRENISIISTLVLQMIKSKNSYLLKYSISSLVLFFYKIVCILVFDRFVSPACPSRNQTPCKHLQT